MKITKSDLKRRILPLFLSGVLSLTGCAADPSPKSKADPESSYSFNRTLVEIGDESFDIEITGDTTIDNVRTTLYLKDGTPLEVSTSDLMMYSRMSDVISDKIKGISPIEIESDNSNAEKTDSYDKALVEVNGHVMDLDIIFFVRSSDNLTLLFLKEGSSIGVSPVNLAIYNDKSPIMKEIKQKVLSKEIKQ